MAALEIIAPTNPTLRQRAKKVKTITSTEQELIDDMIETMRASAGVGLAAPQVGVSKQIIVIEYAEGIEDPETPSKPPKLYVVVNPEIVRRSSTTVVSNEACLSVPGFFGEVERYQALTVKGLDRNGRPIRIKARDWLARIFQHEIDHLDGVLYIDRAAEVWQVGESQEQEFPPAV
jgi:peptide deformylase